ncbi:hypothetical protein KIW84_041223 [Lathyrus oleraceus]|uniref:Uncharacterized protein n=1 Tax=Pisum sativum TaxID=3888 RepID=A0A9D4XC41_PEA|nr:hypothetical protein KIW84_041223 [Pisum sativum]
MYPSLSKFSTQTSNTKAYLSHQELARPRPISPWSNLELCGRENRDELLKEDVIPIWLITQNFQVNWAYAIVHYMSKFQRSNSVRLPYGSLIAKFLFKARIFLDNETLSSTSQKVIEKSQIPIKV